MGSRLELNQDEDEDEDAEADGWDDRAREAPPPLAAGISSGRPLLDRSKVRILLCDNNPTSSAQILQILLSCSYQVISVSTAKQVVNALASHGPDIDIILLEVDLPVSRGFKLLKYIVKKKEWHRIPIIMMSAKDEVSVVVQSLRLGAADFLVKPLRMNELVHLWTHMWRRRRMLGLAEKDVLNCEPVLVESDPSDGIANSMILLSDDSDEISKGNATPEDSLLSTHQSVELKSLTVEAAADTSVENHCAIPEEKEPEVPSGIFSRPKKCELKIGESSAFFIYTKPRIPNGDSGEANRADRSNLTEQTSCRSGNTSYSGAVELGSCTDGGWERYQSSKGHSGGIGGTICMNVPVASVDTEEMKSHLSVPNSSNENQLGFSGVPSAYHLPFFFPGTVEETYRGNLTAQQIPGNPIGLSPPPPYAGVASYLPTMAPLAYQPVGTELPVGNMPAQGLWPPVGSSLKPDSKSGHRMERREAALMKFRQKRKDRCYDKKIRYVNRKRLAEKRPRIRGQFVSRPNGLAVDLNGRPTVSDTDDEDEDDVYLLENGDDQV